MDLWLSTLLRSVHWLEKCFLHVVLGCKFFPSYYKLMSQPVQAQYLVQLLSQLEECHFTASTGSHVWDVFLFLLTSALAAVSNLHIFDDHHHFIMHSSCHHSLLTHFLIRSHTYAWRVWYGGVGGWVGGDNDVRYN